MCSTVRCVTTVAVTCCRNENETMIPVDPYQEFSYPSGRRPDSTDSAGSGSLTKKRVRTLTESTVFKRTDQNPSLYPVARPDFTTQQSTATTPDSAEVSDFDDDDLNENDLAIFHLVPSDDSEHEEADDEMIMPDPVHTATTKTR